MIDREKYEKTDICTAAIGIEKCNSLYLPSIFGIDAYMSFCNEEFGDYRWNPDVNISDILMLNDSSTIISRGMINMLNTLNSSILNGYNMAVRVRVGVLFGEIGIMIALYILIIVRGFISIKENMSRSKNLITLIPINVIQRSKKIREALKL